MVDGAALLLDATERLLGDLADAVPALRAVGDVLAALADGLGVEKVIVAVDDATLGRQVFCSGRVPLGEDGIGLRGRAGAWTQPPSDLDADATRLLVHAVGVGVVRATTRGRTGAAAAGGIRATSAGDAHADATTSFASANDLGRSAETAVTRTSGLTDLVTEATARAVRHGWGFTLVLVRGDAGLAGALGPRLRAADTLMTVSGRELALLLPETAGDRVPYVLARLAQAGSAPPFSYGLACCPADGRDPAVLCRTASQRLEEAWRAATEADGAHGPRPGK